LGRDTGDSQMIDNEEINNYINHHYLESFLCKHEDELLLFLKVRQQAYPSEKNDADWIAFSDLIRKRRKAK
jgi:hypothetical protein